MENTIWNDDCFNVFPRIAESSVDLVVVDLPYGTTALKWDKRIDHIKMWEELKRILKPNGQVIFFCTTAFGYELIKSNEKWFRYDIVWNKTHQAAIGFFNANKQPLRQHEMIYVFHAPVKPKEMKWTYNPQKTEGKPYICKAGKRGAAIYGRETKRRHVINNGDRFPVSVININLSERDKTIHNTQKPLELCEWIIKTYSNENDVVLDFTMGSGSTIMSCIDTKRRYIGVELNKELFEKTEKRINERLNETTLEIVAE